MKKTLFILCALLLTAVGASAQTTDYSYKMSTVIRGDNKGWTNATNMDWGVERYGFTSAGKVLYQTITGLPAGTYTVKFYAFSRIARENALPTADTQSTISQGYAQVGSKAAVTQALTIPTEYTPDHAGFTNDDMVTLTVTLAEGESLEYGIQNAIAGGQWYGVSAISLISDAAPEAKSLSDGDVVEENETDGDHWKIVGSEGVSLVNQVVYNTWSTENDASGMTTPFVQYWRGTGNDLSASTINHYQLGGLPEGMYTLSIFARAFNEGNATDIATSTIFFTANGKSVDITSGTHGSYEGGADDYGTFDLVAEVDNAGTLDIGFSISANSNCDWLAWKNLKVTYLGETLSYSIGTPTCSASCVKPGSDVTITFPDCITPDDTETPVLDSSKSITVGSTTVTATNLSYSGTTATVTFTMPEDIGYGETVSVTVPAGLLSWSGQSVSSAEATFTLTTPAMEDQEGVYLLNCHIDEFISRGFAWGTEADADHYGIPVNIIADEDGLYTIEFVDGSGHLGFTGWAYTDCSGSNIMHYTIEPYSDNGLEGYRFKCEEATTEYGGDCYLYVNESGEFLIANNGHEGTLNDDAQNYSEISQTVWQILSREDRDAHKEAFVASQNAAIAELVSANDLDTYIASKVANDVTRLVTNPDFSAVATSGSSGWVASNMHTEEGNNASASASDNGLEIYDGCEQIQQTITGLTKGVYKIDLKGFFRQATNDVCWPYKDYDMSIAYIDANDYEINLKPWGSEATLEGSTYTPDTKADAYSACATGYANELYTYVGSDGQLVITIAVPGYEYHEWMYVRGMALTYYGDEVEDDSEYKTGDEVTVDGVLYAVASDNMFVNGGFNNGMIGWTAGGYTTDAFPSNFDVQSTGGFNSNPYLTVASLGATSEKTPSQAVAVEKEKTYLFIGYTSGTTPEGERYSALFEMSNATTEANHTEDDGNSYSNTIIQLEWGAEAEQTSNSWTQTMAVFTATTDYVGMRMGWSNGSYDGFQLYEVEPVADEVTWTMTEAEWGTIILPFDASIPTTDDSGNEITWKAYSCAGLESDGETLTLTNETTLVANTPYILSGDAGTYTFKGTPVEATSGLTAGLLTGTFVNMTYDNFTHDGTQYLLQNHVDDGGVAFYPVVENESSEATLTPYHCYLTDSSGKGVRGFISFPDSGEATGIVAVDGAEAEGNGAIYDLSGRRVSKAVKGVYIQNGKKVLVK